MLHYMQMNKSEDLIKCQKWAKFLVKGFLVKGF